jgi:glycine/D-amino acid oxidase-like deaminating enzyme
VNAAAAPHRSLWLQQALGDEPPAPPLEGAARADVAIVGGGYVGLWTALRIKEHDPSCDVVVLERDICGGGASGRNAGWILSWAPKLPTLMKICGEDEALRIYHASEAVIDEIWQLTQQHGIDIDYHRDGWLWVASSPAQLDTWEGTVALCERYGITAFQRLDPAEARARAGSDLIVGAVHDTTTALIQPAKLARGLRRLALEAGVRIYENTPMLSFEREYPVAIRTARGRLAADRMVIAMNAWAAGVRELGRAIGVTASDSIATEPIPARLTALRLTGGEGITDSRLRLHYYRVTPDQRLLFGGGGGGIALGGRIGPEFDGNPTWQRATHAAMLRFFPSLAEVRITHHWAGPIDRSPDALPLLGTLPSHPHISYGVGWSGNGVGPSVLGGRILAGLALGLDNEWTVSPFVNRSITGFPPEPVRFVGMHVVRRSVRHMEDALDAGRTPNPLAVRLAAFAGGGLEDRSS